MAEGRIVAIRVSDADFAALEELKRQKGLGWNQLLLGPVSREHGISLEGAKVKAPKLEEEPAKGKKGKKARTETDPIPEPVGDPPPPPDYVPDK